MAYPSALPLEDVVDLLWRNFAEMVWCERLQCALEALEAALCLVDALPQPPELKSKEVKNRLRKWSFVQTNLEIRDEWIQHRAPGSLHVTYLLHDLAEATFAARFGSTDLLRRL